MSRLIRNSVLLSMSIALAAAASSAEASDKSMRCGRYLIHAGGGKDSAVMYEVLKKCGQPEAKNGDQWIYRQNNVHRVLTFNFEGRLQRIESHRGS